jgi:hypothetical protein
MTAIMADVTERGRRLNCRLVSESHRTLLGCVRCRKLQMNLHTCIKLVRLWSPRRVEGLRTLPIPLFRSRGRRTDRRFIQFGSLLLCSVCIEGYLRLHGPICTDPVRAPSEPGNCSTGTAQGNLRCSRLYWTGDAPQTCLRNEWDEGLRSVARDIAFVVEDSGVAVYVAFSSTDRLGPTR